MTIRMGWARSVAPCRATLVRRSGKAIDLPPMGSPSFSACYCRHSATPMVQECPRNSPTIIFNTMTMVMVTIGMLRPPRPIRSAA